MIWLLLKLILFLAILIFSSEWLVRILSKLAHNLKISYFLVAFLIMALATSIPELFIGITSALQNSSELALGVVLGTIIASALVLASDAIFAKSPIIIAKTIEQKDLLYSALIALLPIIFILNRQISRLEGLILLIVFALFAYHIFWAKKKFLKSGHRHHSHIVAYENKLHRSHRLLRIAKYFFFFVIGVIILTYSAKFVVGYGKEIAQIMHIPLVVIGITLLAFSTTLPELVFETKAVRMGRNDLALGDLVGTMVANSGLILGVVALINPITIKNLGPYLISFAYLLLFLIFIMFNMKRPIRRLNGFLLLVSYILFLVLQIYYK